MILLHHKSIIECQRTPFEDRLTSPSPVAGPPFWFQPDSPQRADALGWLGLQGILRRQQTKTVEVSVDTWAQMQLDVGCLSSPPCVSVGVSLEHATAQGCRACVGSQVPLSWLELVKNNQGKPCFKGSSWLLVLTAKPVKKGEGEVQGQDSVCDSLFPSREAEHLLLRNEFQ